MNKTRANDLGDFISRHATSPRSLQRSAVVAVMAFFFFLVMMAAFYARQWFVYFLLATAFLIVNLFTLAGIWLQKRNKVRLYENGLIYKKDVVIWDEITRLRLDAKSGLTLELADARELTIPAVIQGLPRIVEHINSRRAAV